MAVAFWTTFYSGGVEGEGDKIISLSLAIFYIVSHFEGSVNIHSNRQSHQTPYNLNVAHRQKHLQSSNIDQMFYKNFMVCWVILSTLIQSSSLFL